MTLTARHSAILEILLKERSASVTRLSTEFSVSEMTIRRDLDELEEQGLVQRTHGGAKPNETRLHELSWKVKLGQYVDEKKRIGQAAADLITDGDTVLLDTGSTTAQIVPHLAKKQITAITNALSIATELATFPQVQVFVAGGMLRKGLLSLIGPQTEAFLRGLNVDKLFLGVDAIDLEAGFTVPNLLDAHTKQTMMKCARQIIVVADHSKLQRRALAPVAPLSEAHRVITDSGAPADFIEQLRTHVNVQVV